MADLKRTPLFDVYERHGARLVDFGGWELPVQFSGITGEHLAVRRDAGIFDVSHMGEIRVSGPGALDFLQYAATNDASKLRIGQSQYSAILNEKGGIIDDIFVYRVLEQDYLICVNAANAEADFEWLSNIDKTGYFLRNESSDWGQIALQGPRAGEIFTEASDNDFFGIPRMGIATASFGPVKVLAARTGYTGESGVEIFMLPADAVKVWEALVAAGADKGLVPAGLGARDTLRLEMGYPLHGHDIGQETTPLEADLAWIVAMEKEDFIGKAALAEQLEKGLKQKRIGFVMKDSGIPRDGYKIAAPSGEGRVTSGTKTPSAGKALGMGYVPAEDAAEGTEIEIDIRGKLKKAVVEKWPFFKK